MKRSILFFALACGLSTAASASTIAEIAAMPEGSPATAGTVIILSTTDLVADPGYRSFQIRDATRAMSVYGTNAEIAAALAGFATADIIEISGQTVRLDGALTLITGSVAGFAVTGRTSTLPMFANALTVASTDIAEPYESNLVCLKNVSFAAEGDSFTVGSDYALAGSPAWVHIATAGLGLAGQPVPTGLLDITGIVIPNPTGDGYRLAPRSPGDIVPVPEPGLPGILGLTLALALSRRKRAGQAARTEPGEYPIFSLSPTPSFAPHPHQP